MAVSESFSDWLFWFVPLMGWLLILVLGYVIYKWVRNRAWKRMDRDEVKATTLSGDG